MRRKDAAKPFSTDQVLDKMVQYCAYQERCTKEVKEKLMSFGLSDNERQQLFEYLLDNRFVDDRRYVRSFVRGKINQSGWGLNKIRYQLRLKGIDETSIAEALDEIDDTLYRQRLEQILRAKTVKAANDFETRQKLARFAIQKGFEPATVWEVLKEII